MLLADDSDTPRTLIDELLEEQQRLTAVERFAKKHDRHEIPAQSRYYRDLIPITAPGAGEQYAFAVDLDLCTGCKACVSACHSLNGLDDDEIWRNIGLVHGGTLEKPYQQIVTTACHHCVEPGCLHGCPVKAYEKDEATGIVRHLDDQCIGCQYCVLKCPYDVPKYSKKRGIVRKCDMCYGRLGVGEAPACVQSCPSGAITIRTISKAAFAADIQPGDRLLPGAYDSSYTKPTTVYESRRTMPADARPGDSAALRLEHPHWPLILMLLLTQMAAGIHACATGIAMFDKPLFNLSLMPLAVAAFVILNLGLFVSVLHLGRPLGAWRAFLGLRTSWMSREIFAFSIFAAPAAGFAAAALWCPRFAASVAAVTTVLGLAAIFCSVMIYVDTRRAFWTLGLTSMQFFGSIPLLGLAGTAATLAWMPAVATASIHTLFVISALVQCAFFAWECLTFRAQLTRAHDPNHRSALIIWNLLRKPVIARAVLSAVSLLCALLAIICAGTPSALLATAGLVCLFAAQIIGRYFFFTAVVAYRMPGALVAGSTPHA